MSRSHKLFITACLMLTLTGLGLIALEGTLQIKEKAVWGDVVSAVIQRLQYVKSPQQQPTGNRSATANDGGAEQQPLVADRVNLPDVEGHFWLTFLYQDNWQTDAETVRLNNMFHSDPRLVAMRKRCRVNSFSQMDPYMTDRWQKYVGSNTPMVVLQSPDGRLCFKASRGNLPANSDEMVKQIQESLDQCFRRPCPNPSPAPAPQPNPQPIAPVNPLPDTIGPAEEPRTAGDPLWLLPVLGITGAIGGALLGRRRK